LRKKFWSVQADSISIVSNPYDVVASSLNTALDIGHVFSFATIPFKRSRHLHD
jgi:hypothetical protein